jgi:hypothetical protein
MGRRRERKDIGIMSVKYYSKKAFSTIFNDQAAIPVILGALSSIIAPVFIAGDLTHPDPSEFRTPVAGDRQFAQLDKSLATLVKMKAEGGKGKDVLLSLRQEIMLNPEDAGLKEREQAQHAKQDDLAKRLSSFETQFVTQTLLSKDISEKDAEMLLKGYRAAVGPNNAMYGYMSERLRHLDECQTKVLGKDVRLNYEVAADQINDCMISERDSSSIAALGTGLAGGSAGFWLFNAALLPLGARFRREIEEEDRRRREKKARDTENGVTTDEVRLKVTIQKPKS